MPSDVAIPPRNIMKSACPRSGICSDGQACPAANLCVSDTGNTSTGIMTTTGNATSQQTAVATSAITDTVQDAGAGAKLGDSGCSCRMGAWASAESIGPWLLAGIFGAVVAMPRRRRGSRE